MTDTDTTGLVGFPLTYDADAEGPTYTAASYRMTAGAAHAVPDGSPFGGIQGVRAGSPAPLVSMDGTTATIRPHMGWLCPWSGAGVYEYAITKPVQVAVGSSTGSYKIAVVLADQAAGHGSGEQVTVQTYAATMDDRMIDGLVIATVTAGLASDQAPVIGMDATIRVNTLARLQAVKAAEGTRGITRDGTEYRMQSGSWSPVMLGGCFIGDTDGNGMVVIPVPSTPREIYLQAATVGDDNRRFWHPVVWNYNNRTVTVRIMDARDAGWTGAQHARFFWRIYF